MIQCAAVYLLTNDDFRLETAKANTSSKGAIWKGKITFNAMNMYQLLTFFLPKIMHWFLGELSPRAPFSIHKIALLGKQLGKNIGERFDLSSTVTLDVLC